MADDYSISLLAFSKGISENKSSQRVDAKLKITAVSLGSGKETLFFFSIRMIRVLVLKVLIVDL